MGYHAVLVEGIEDLGDFGTGVLLAGLGSGEPEELVELDTSGAVFVQLGEDLIDELVASNEAQIDEGLLQFSGVNDSASIIVEDVEGLLNFDDVVLGQDGSHIVVDIEGLFGLSGLTLGGGCCLLHPGYEQRYFN